MLQLLIVKPNSPRHRRIYAVWIAIVICAGLASRSDAVGLPPFFAKYAGDALWALMVFLGIGFIVPSWSAASVASLATVVSRVVEFSQLYQTPCLDAARRTSFGRLALGDTFAWGDIAAYLVGIAFGASAEWLAGVVKMNANTRAEVD